MKTDTLLCSSLGRHFLLTSFALDPATLRQAAPRCQARRTGWSSVLQMRRARSWRTPGPPRPPRPRTGSRGHQERNDLSDEQNLKKVRKKIKNPKLFSRCFMVFMGVFRCFSGFFEDLERSKKWRVNIPSDFRCFRPPGGLCGLGVWHLPGLFGGENLATAGNGSQGVDGAGWWIF